MQVVGLCRFSYPAEGGFQIEHDTLEARRAFLYDPARLEERFRHFEAVTLPGLTAQTDPDFAFLIVIGDDLPDPWLTRLMDLVAGFPQARVVAEAPGPHRQVMQKVLNRAREGRDDLCLQFRHDDDDAVAVDFVARLREAANDCAGLLARNRMVAFDFNRGYIARPSAQGIVAEETMTPYWGVALATAVRPGVKQTIMNFGHNKLNRFMPTVTFTDSAMYVRGHNDFNDSRQKKNITRPDLVPLDAETRAIFRDRFAIDEDQVRGIFA